jgi:hypothetical protein
MYGGKRGKGIQIENSKIQSYFFEEVGTEIDSDLDNTLWGAIKRNEIKIGSYGIARASSNGNYFLYKITDECKPIKICQLTLKGEKGENALNTPAPNGIIGDKGKDGTGISFKVLIPETVGTKDTIIYSPFSDWSFTPIDFSTNADSDWSFTPIDFPTNTNSFTMLKQPHTIGLNRIASPTGSIISGIRAEYTHNSQGNTFTYIKCVGEEDRNVIKDIPDENMLQLDVADINGNKPIDDCYCSLKGNFLVLGYGATAFDDFTIHENVFETTEEGYERFIGEENTHITKRLLGPFKGFIINSTLAKEQGIDHYGNSYNTYNNRRYFYKIPDKVKKLAFVIETSTVEGTVYDSNTQSNYYYTATSDTLKMYFKYHPDSDPSAYALGFQYIYTRHRTPATDAYGSIKIFDDGIKYIEYSENHAGGLAKRYDDGNYGNQSFSQLFSTTKGYIDKNGIAQEEVVTEGVLRVQSADAALAVFQEPGIRLNVISD